MHSLRQWRMLTNIPMVSSFKCIPSTEIQEIQTDMFQMNWEQCTNVIEYSK